MKKDIYCDLESLVLLSKGRDRYWESRDEGSPDRIYSDYANVINNSDLHIDCEENDFAEEAERDKWIFKIYQNYYFLDSASHNNVYLTTGAIQALLYDPPLQNEINYNSLVISKPCHDINASKRGVLNIWINEDGISSNIIKMEPDSLEKYEHSSWTEVFQRLNAMLNCNSMIIADNFIFSETNERDDYISNMKNNLYEILNILLPKQLDLRFHLTIFSSFYDRLDDSGHVIQTVDDRLEEKKRELYEMIITQGLPDADLPPLRPQLKGMIDIEVFNDVVNQHKKDKYHHKRLIITNQYIITSEKILLFYDRGNGTYAADSSPITISYPMINHDNESLYWIKLKESQECLYKHRKRSNNRLLRFYKGEYIDINGGKIRLERYPDLTINNQSENLRNNDTVTFELNVMPDRSNHRNPVYSANNVCLPDTIIHKPFSAYTP